MEDDDPDDPFKKKPEPRVYEEDTIWTACTLEGLSAFAREMH